MKKILIGIFILLVITIMGLVKYINYTTHYISSNAGFVKNDSLTMLSFKIGGKINYININEGQKIFKNQILASLDISDFNITIQRLKAEINSLNKRISKYEIEKEKLNKDINYNIEILKNNLSKIEFNIKAMQSNIKADYEKLKKLKYDYEKYNKLYKQNATSKDNFLTAKSNYFYLLQIIESKKNSLSSLIQDKQNTLLKIDLEKNKKNNIKEIQKEILSLKDKIIALQKEIKLNQQYIKESIIKSPFNAILAKRFKNKDEIVKPSENVLSIVNPNKSYILVYLEEKKLKNLKVGNKAIIHIDYLDKNFNGYVSEILPVSASSYALIPRDFSSGEFTKLQQRFYIKIKLNKNIPLKIGASAEVKIKVK